MTDQQNKLPEAVASVTYSVLSPKGFPALVTYRSETFGGLFENMKVVEESFVTEGYKPQIKPTFGVKKEVEYIQGRVCPECGGRLIAKTSQNGKSYEQCENYKYDFTQKKNIGTCNYIKFN